VGRAGKIALLSPPASPGFGPPLFNQLRTEPTLCPARLTIHVVPQPAPHAQRGRQGRPRRRFAIINRAALDVEAVRISQKQVNDFVTEVDHASEKAIIETLLTAYPEHGILAEESGSQHGAKDADCVWIIDPLDGTTNFIHGFPVYCVSIALAVRGKVEQAVIYDPSRNDLFTATKGRGAYLNERRIRVSKRTRLQECLISTGFPFRKGDNFNATCR
jgi:myo-inositol-1(or 4)-monophosphatase